MERALAVPTWVLRSGFSTKRGQIQTQRPRIVTRTGFKGGAVFFPAFFFFPSPRTCGFPKKPCACCIGYTTLVRGPSPASVLASAAIMTSMRVSPMSAKDGEDEEQSSLTSFVRQFWALARKNVLSKRRSKLQLVSERRQCCVLPLCCVRLSVRVCWPLLNALFAASRSWFPELHETPLHCVPPFPGDHFHARPERRDVSYQRIHVAPT